MIGNEIVGSFHPRIKNSNSLNVYIIDVPSTVNGERLSSACVKNFEFFHFKNILLVP